MDGKNSSGRKISLLNEDTAPVPLYHSRSSSLTSTPCLSPRTPQLIRSESADSAIMQTPSPITPDLTYDGLGISHQAVSPVFSEPSFFSQTKIGVGYPPVVQPNGPLPYPPVVGAVQQPLPQSPPQATGFYAPQASNSTERRSSGQPKSKKNSYPCPMAKQFNCNDYFTTSGHAARHAKKHTGKKDAFCPECNKAFTRKDNMEQHRRTHQNGRNASKNGDDKGKRVKQAAKQRSKPELPQPQMFVDPSLPISPTTTYGYTPTLPMVDPYGMDYSAVARTAYPDPTQFAQHPVQPIQPGDYNTHQRSPSYALDALAIAASGENASG